MPSTTPCVPRCSSTPLIVQIPGASGIPGDDGPQGEQGPQGDAGPAADLTVYSAFGSGSAFTMPENDTSVLLNLGTVQPSIVLVDAGTYLLFARGKFNGASGGATTTTQILKMLIQCINNTVGPVANTTKTFNFIPGTTIVGTLAELSILAVPYVATAGDNLQLFGSINAAVTNTVECTEADIIAIKIADA